MKLRENTVSYKNGFKVIKTHQMEEEMLWKNNILGDHTPESLLNTIIVYMND